MTGARSQNTLIAFIYNKHSKISAATNKDISSGEVVNFVQVDAGMLFWLCYQMGDIARMPMVFGLAFVFLFLIFDLSFLAGLGVFVVAFLFNVVLGMYINKV